MQGDRYQLALIFLGVLVSAFLFVFLFRELYPEYKIYQNRYRELEEFRASYIGEEVPPFRPGIKQIVLEREDQGPVVIDRCTSCHVAMKLEHFSSTRVAYDKEGKPYQEQNPDYVWGQLEMTIEKLRREGNSAEADRLEGWKTVTVGDVTYDMTRVIAMHPLIGEETRPFEHHPVEEYGCVSCHNGNGRGLTTEKAHGPVYDEDYEAEFTGPTPLFTEPDPKNDPTFSRVFNGKPGHGMLFQTTPLFVGSLIQAKCMQCHQRSPTIDPLTQNYHEGERLYVSQACYPCHRIAGEARGGVGPDLTEIGDYYPWYIKESIVWPQADLKTSTMPNYKLDHGELEDLVTYLLGQKGRPKKLSEVEYKEKILAWETGQKTPIEQPVSPSQVRDLRFGMTLFATEGCAACHRLKGYESNVGYRIEKNDPDFATLFEEHRWFQRLIPEEIIGSEIVKVAEEHAGEIDQRIVDDIRSGALLEEIEAAHPGTLGSFNAGFSYAMRAKNHLMLSQEEQAKWNGRIHRLQMMYIQEYGLGRLVGPRPNWGGIYRSDEWLMGHFWKPSAYSARSIMPVFPFDDSKFYALTYMLNVIARKNRDAVHEIWEERGFDPEMAAEIFCSQCHGPHLHGNGPVAEWIYPIPKNLRNANFLRKLTKKNVIESLTHGIKGGPMPPWGEVATDKRVTDNIPVLTEDQIKQLADWLFASLAGEGIIREEEDVPKWQYDPEDILKELLKEKNILDPKEMLSLLAQRGMPAPMKGHPDISTVFDTFKTPDGEEKVYIKEKYYTDKNFRAGKAIFEVSCAVCHGKELDGAGYRAGTMFDAKPRMLSNLKWLRTRDDLRLLRSIKYGVSGTSMSPWGDQTSSLQRLQLVIYIRMLNQVQNLREDLFSYLYQTYDAQLAPIEEARFFDNARLGKLENERAEVAAAHEALYSEVRAGALPPERALPLYQQELDLQDQIETAKQRDQLLQELKNGVKKEKELFQNYGILLINQEVDHPIYAHYLDLIGVQVTQFTFEGEKLGLQLDPAKERQQQALAGKVLAQFNQKLQTIEAERHAVTGKITSAEKDQQLDSLDQREIALNRLKSGLLEAMKQAAAIRQQQKKILSNF